MSGYCEVPKAIRVLEELLPPWTRTHTLQCCQYLILGCLADDPVKKTRQIQGIKKKLFYQFQQFSYNCSDLSQNKDVDLLVSSPYNIK